MLTVGADTANVVLAGLLVRHRGPLAAGLASGVYAVYPAALTASSSLFLEPWLNLFCLLGAVLLFDGGRIRGQEAGRAGARSGPGLFRFRRLRSRSGPSSRPWWRGPCASWPGAAGCGSPGGFAAGIAVPCLPFLALAPSGFGRTVFVSELVQATHGRVGANPRVADITGITGLSSVGVDPHIWAGLTAAGALVLLVAAAWCGTAGGPRWTGSRWSRPSP